MSQVDELEMAGRDQDFARWCELMSEVAPRRPLRPDLPKPNDEVFAAAVQVFVTRRANLEMWLRIASKDRDKPPFGMTEVVKYMTEAEQVVQTAAEAYIFGLPKLRRRVSCMLKEEVDPLALKKRIDARQKIYDDAFGPDDGELIDIDEVPDDMARPVK